MNYATSALSSHRAFPGENLTSRTAMAARWSLSPSSQSRQLWEVKEHPPDPGKYRKIGRTSTYLPGLSDLRCDSAEAGSLPSAEDHTVPAYTRKALAKVQVDTTEKAAHCSWEVVVVGVEMVSLVS